MRILFLTHRLPYPPNKGDKIRSYNILRYLSSYHEIHLGTLVDDKNDLNYLSHVSDLVKSLSYDRVHSFFKKLISAKALMGSKPISVSFFYSNRLQKKIDSLLDQMPFDVLLCYSSPMAEYFFRSKHRLNGFKHSLRLMDLIDVDSCKWQQYAEGKSVGERWVYQREARSLSAYENKIVKEFDQIFLVSGQERSLFLQSHKANNVTVMMNGVDLKYFIPDFPKKITEEGPILVFTGAMNYWPNIQGVEWFVRKVLPKIRTVFPSLTFWVVGSHPVPAVQRLGQLKGVEVTGYVEDVRDYLAAADVCVVPLLIARGIQNKLLEAMAMGKAVVCTPQALEGIEAAPETDLLVSENSASFADSVIRLLNDRLAGHRIGRNARQFVESKFSWEQNLSVLKKVLQLYQFREKA